MVRVLALKTVGGLDVGDSAAVQRAASRLHRADWTSVFESDPLVFPARAGRTLGEYLAEHRQRAIEQLEVLRSVDGPLRARGLSLHGQAAQLAIRSPLRAERSR